MHYAALAGVVVDNAVILIGDFLSRPVSCRRNRRLALAPADNFDTAMANGNGHAPFILADNKKLRGD
jgi:hypothetical protein